MMLLGGWGLQDLNDDDDDDGTISYKNKKAAAMIYHPLLMIFLIKNNIIQQYKLKFIGPVIAELRPSPEWTVHSFIFS